jgi:hypothetical protein
MLVGQSTMKFDALLRITELVLEEYDIVAG